MDLVSKIKSLNLPLGKYLVFGSAVMEMSGIRKAKDIDLLINEELYKELRNKGWKRKWNFKRVLTCKAVKKDNVECFTNLKWKDYQYETEKLIKNAEIIDGIPFMKLSEYLEYKKHLPREKDKQDVVLMENFFTKSSSNSSPSSRIGL
jgi:hypothetical protein